MADELDGFLDPAQLVSAATFAEVGRWLTGADPTDIVDIVMDTAPSWWSGLDEDVDETLTSMAELLLDDPDVDLAMIGLTRAGYRLGRLLVGERPHADPAPDLLAHAERIEAVDGDRLLDHLPDEATPLALWLSEELIRRNGWWRGRTDVIDDEEVPEDLAELRGAGIAAVEIGFCAALVEHDLLVGRGPG
jgi:hypothetical protein